MEFGLGTKKRKVSTTSKRLPVPEESSEVASVTIETRSLGKEAPHPPLPKARVKTKVKTSKSLTPVGSTKGASFVAVSSPIQGSLGSPSMIPCLSKGPFRQIRSK